MGKRCFVEHADYEPPLKKSSTVLMSPTADVKSGMILTDVSGKKWRLGKSIGTGGFGEIFSASDCITNEVKTDAGFVAKVEGHTSGPLFVEIHCYLRIAKTQMINEWKSKTGIKHLGIPEYVAFGSHKILGTKYRFLIIPRFDSDLEKMFNVKRHKFNLKTVLTICLEIINVLQYIHSKGYLHLDIKASNIGFNLNNTMKTIKSSPITSKGVVRYRGSMPVRLCKAQKLTSPRVLRPNSNLRTLSGMLDKNCNIKENVDKVYLLDYGLACKYLRSDGTHKGFSKDQRKAHAGTILFCSRDAHLGAQSRRSDLECLGFNVIYWLTAKLPWSDNTDNPCVVYKKKLKCMENLKQFIDYSFDYESPTFVYEYFNYLLKMDFEDKPDYNYCKKIFKDALLEYGYKNDMQLGFDQTEAYIPKPKKVKTNLDNFKMQCAIEKFKRTPLNSNLPIRPILRKELLNNKLKQRLNWSKILLNSENIRKMAKTRNRERKMTESSETSITNLNIKLLNPNATMLDIFNKSLDRYHTSGTVSPDSRVDSLLDTTTIEGYTPAMIEMYKRKRKRELTGHAETKFVRKTSKPRKFKAKLTKRKTRSAVKMEVFHNKKKKKSLKGVGLRKTYSLRG